MKTNACCKPVHVLFIVSLLFILLACSVGSTDRVELSAEDQIATGVAATQLAKQGAVEPQDGEQPAQESASTEEPAQPEPASPQAPIEEPQQPAALAPSGAGLSRADPLPPGVLVSVPNWDIQLLEYHRSQEALTLINAGANKEITVPEGKEIVLVKFFVRCTSFEDKAFSLGLFDLGLTGDSHVVYGDQTDEWPQPEFYYYDMFTAEAVEGWLDAVVPAGEQNLMAVVNLEDTDSNSPAYGTRTIRYLALEPGSAINLPAAYASRTANELGLTTGSPAGVGQLVSMPEWDITLLEVMVGPDADALLQQNNNLYQAPEAGFAYSLWHFKLQYFGEQDWPMSLSFYNFDVTNVTGSRLSDTARRPQNPDRNYLSDAILPGAEVDGWVVLQVPQAGTPYLVQFRYDSDSPGLTDEERYFTAN